MTFKNAGNSDAIALLQDATDQFFMCHWNERAVGSKPPSWSEPWRFSGTLHNHDKQGVYAFLRGSTVIYLGVGASRGKAGYEGHGLGARVQKYIRHNGGGEYRPHDERMLDADCVVTIGFDKGCGYLAPALESYLIGRIPTPHNIQKPGA